MTDENEATVRVVSLDWIVRLMHQQSLAGNSYFTNIAYSLFNKAVLKAAEASEEKSERTMKVVGSYGLHLPVLLDEKDCDEAIERMGLSAISDRDTKVLPQLQAIMRKTIANAFAEPYYTRSPADLDGAGIWDGYQPAKLDILDTKIDLVDGLHGILIAPTLRAARRAFFDQSPYGIDLTDPEAKGINYVDALRMKSIVFVNPMDGLMTSIAMALSRDRNPAAIFRKSDGRRRAILVPASLMKPDCDVLAAQARACGMHLVIWIDAGFEDLDTKMQARILANARSRLVYAAGRIFYQKNPADMEPKVKPGFLTGLFAGAHHSRNR